MQCERCTPIASSPSPFYSDDDGDDDDDGGDDEGRPDPLEEAGRVLADVREAADDVVQVEVAERGVVLALPPHLNGHATNFEYRRRRGFSMSFGSGCSFPCARVLRVAFPRLGSHVVFLAAPCPPT